MPIAILIVMVAAAIGGGLILRQYSEMEKETSNVPETEYTKIDTSDWKIYKNEEYEFEIMYPKNLLIEKITVEDWPFEDLKIYENGDYICFGTSGEKFIPRMCVAFFENTSKLPDNTHRLSFKEYFEAPRVFYGSYPGAYKFSIDDIDVDCDECLEIVEETSYTSIEPFCYTIRNVILYKKDHIYSFAAPFIFIEEYDEVFYNEWANTFNQMLSSFKFIE